MSNKSELRTQMKRYFRERDTEQLKVVIREASERLGRAEVERMIVDEVLPDLSRKEQEWWISQLPDQTQSEMGDQVREAVFSILTEEGFEVGKDFSVGPERGLMISDRARDFLLSQMPEEERAELERELFKLSQNPYQLIEEQLGVPFFDNLKKTATARLQGLDDAMAIGYLANITEGIVQKHPELTDFKEWFLSSVLDFDRLNRLIATEATDCGDISFFLGDIVSAAGASQEVTEQDGRQLVTQSGLKLLSQVWDGGDVSIRDLIAQLDQKT